MKNTYSYLLLTSLRVCLVIAGCFEIKGAGASYVIRQPTPSKVMVRLIKKTKYTLCSSIKI